MDQALAILEPLQRWAEPYARMMAAGAWDQPVAVPLWAATGGLALVVVLLIGWLFRSRSHEGGSSGGLFRFLLLVLAAAVAWKGFGYLDDTKRVAARQALEDRVARAVAVPIEGNTLLACASGVINLDLRSACERTVFAKPENAAAAVALVKDRLELLGVVADPAHGLGGEDGRTVRLRRSLETDDFGLVAHVLVELEDCRPEACGRFELFREPEKIRANMVARTFEGLVEKHAAAWAGPAAPPRAAAATGGGPGPSAAAEPETAPASIWAVPSPSESPEPAAVAAPAAAPPPQPSPPAQPVPSPPRPQQAARPQPSAAPARPAATAAPRQQQQQQAAPAQSSAPVVRQGGLPPPQSLAPPPGTPPAPGVPPRLF